MRLCYVFFYLYWVDYVYIVDDVIDLMVMKSLMLEILKVGLIDYIVLIIEKSILIGGFFCFYFGIVGSGFEIVFYMMNKLVMKIKFKMEGIFVVDFLCVS